MANEHYHNKGVPLYLVIDNCHEIEEAKLEILQKFAKLHADIGDLIIVFVSSDGEVNNE